MFFLILYFHPVAIQFFVLTHHHFNFYVTMMEKTQRFFLYNFYLIKALIILLQLIMNFLFFLVVLPALTDSQNQMDCNANSYAFHASH